MSAKSHALPQSDRPAPVRLAVLLSIIAVIVSIPFYFAPGFEDVPLSANVFAVVAGIVTLAALRWLWECRRWAAIVIFAITALNVVSSIPGLVEPSSGWVVAAILIGMVFAIPVLVLLVLPESRRSYR